MKNNISLILFSLFFLCGIFPIPLFNLTIVAIVGDISQIFTAPTPETVGYYGYSVSVSSDGLRTAIGGYNEDGGAVSDAGEVDIYLWNGTTWNLEQTLIAPTPQASAHFGIVSMSGDGTRLVVGSDYEDAGGSDTGRAYVYLRSGTTWSLEQTINSPNVEASGFFGKQVSLSGDGTRMLISAFLEGASDEGRVYVYLRTGTTWTLEQAITVTGRVQFGISANISSDGTRFIAASNSETGIPVANAGRVYIYSRSGTTWSLEQTLDSPTPESIGYYGHSSSISEDGSRAIVGAYQEADASFTDAGKVYIYSRTGTTWTLEQTILSPTPFGTGWFGYDVSISPDNNRVLIGAPRENGGIVASGKGYVYLRTGITWALEKTFVSTNPETYGYFGFSVSQSNVSSNSFKSVIGADEETVTGLDAAGRVYIFSTVLTTPIIPQADFSYQSTLINPTPAASEGFGYTSAISSDGNYYVVGVPKDTTLGIDAGYVYVYVRSGSTWTLQQNLLIPTPSTYDNYGSSVAISSDGSYAVVGAYGEDPGITDSGSLYVFNRNGSTWTHQGTLSMSSPSASAFFGYTAGISADGAYAIGGGYNYSGSQGTCATFVRTGSTWAFQQTLVNPTPAANDQFSASSVNLSGDGTYAAVSAQGDTNGGFAYSGAVYIYLRTGTTWALQQTILNPTPALNDYFGVSSDISADGLYLIIGSHNDDTDATDAGLVYIYFRNGTTFELQHIIHNPIPGPISGDGFGLSATLSDDGRYAVISAYMDDTLATNAGSTYVYERSGTIWTLKQTITKPSGGVDDNFGLMPSLSGNGLYVAIGAEDNTGGQTNSGSVYFYARPEVSNFNYLYSVVNPTPGIDDGFGIRNAISNDGLYTIVGIASKDIGGTDIGYAYILSRSGNTWTLQNLPNPFPNTYDQFGAGVGISNDGLYAVTGSFGEDNGGTDTGSIYVFLRTGSTYTYQAALTQTPATGGALFGYYSPSISGDGQYVMGGALSYSGGSGSASIFYRTGTTWTQQAYITNPTPAGNDNFGIGTDLSYDGTYAVAAAYNDDTGATNAGSVYVYNRVGTTWTLQQTINNPAPFTDDDFGNDLKISGNGLYILAGAYADDTGAQNAGTVYVYFRTGSTWTLQQTINNPAPGVSDYFGAGISVSDDGTIAIITAYMDDNTFTDAGVSYVYERSGTVWTLKQTINKTAAVSGDQFGVLPSLSGDGLYAAIGGNDDVGGVANAGSLYFYTSKKPLPPGPNFNYQFSLTNPTPAADDIYSYSAVAISNDGLYSLVGSPHDDTQNADTGYAYIFSRTGDTWALQYSIPSPTPVASYDNWGTSAFLSNDGQYALVGGYTKDTGATDSGGVGIYLRTGTSWALQQFISNPTPGTNDYFGLYTSMSGDGLYAIIGGLQDDTNATDAGSAYIYLRTGTTWALQQTINNPDPATGDLFGSGVSMSSDGLYAIVGAYSDDAGASNSGSAYIYTRTGATWTLQQTLPNPTPALDDNFGLWTGISGDGLYAIVGSQGDDTGASNAGSAYIYFRTGSTWTLQATINNPTPAIDDRFAARLSISDDGTYALISAYIDDTGATNSGSAYTFTRSGTTWSLYQTITNPTPAVDDYFGYGAAMSRDGLYSLIGAFNDDTGAANSGSAYVFKR